MITTINEFKAVFENANTPLSWEQYCEEVFAAEPTEVENILINDGYTQETINDYKNSIYYILGVVYEPEFNDKNYEALLNKKFNLPSNLIQLDTEIFFDKNGSEVYYAIAYDGEDGLIPYSMDF